MQTSIIDKVIEQLKDLPQEMQWRVLEFTRALTSPNIHGIAGGQYLQFAGTISLDDIHTMQLAIEQGCEQVDTHEW
jgi:hypothetical protein